MPNPHFSQSANTPSLHAQHHSIEALRDQLNKVIVAGRQISAIVWGIGLVLSTFIASLILFKDEIKSLFSHQTADVASAALDHQAVQDKASAFGKVTVQQILDDREIIDKSVDFVKDLLVQPETVSAASELFTQVLGKESVITAASILGGQVSRSVLEDPATLEKFTKLVSDTLKTPEVYDACKGIISRLAQDPQTVQDLSKLAQGFMSDEQFRMALSEMLSYLLLEIMKNKDVEVQIGIFLSSLLAQEDLHRSGGEALRSSMSHFLLGSWINSLPFMGSKSGETIPPTPSENIGVLSTSSTPKVERRPSLDEIRPSSESQKLARLAQEKEKEKENTKQEEKEKVSVQETSNLPTQSQLSESIPQSQANPSQLSKTNTKQFTFETLSNESEPEMEITVRKDKDDPDQGASPGEKRSTQPSTDISTGSQPALLNVTFDSLPSNFPVEKEQNNNSSVWGLINSISPFSQ